jgi:hypothetical protein
MHASTKAMAASAVVLILTALHHLHGAAVYDTPWRAQVALGTIPVLVVLVLALAMYRRHPQIWLGRAATWLFIVVSLTVCVGLVGLFEGGYKHLVRNALFFGVTDPRVRERLFPTSTYEAPSDLLFEVTGVLQLIVALIAAYYTARLMRREETGTP